MNYLVLTKCDDTTALQAKLAYFASQSIDGLSSRISMNEETSRYIFDMFKVVKYSEDGSKSVGILEIFPQYFEGVKDEDGNIIKPDLFTVINTGGEVLKVLASGIKYQEDVYDNLTDESILSIREVIDEFITIQDESGDDVIVEQSYRFAGLA